MLLNCVRLEKLFGIVPLNWLLFRYLRGTKCVMQVRVSRPEVREVHSQIFHVDEAAEVAGNGAVQAVVSKISDQMAANGGGCLPSI